jgi:hypothetical protein
MRVEHEVTLAHLFRETMHDELLPEDESFDEKCKRGLGMSQLEGIRFLSTRPRRRQRGVISGDSESERLEIRKEEQNNQVLSAFYFDTRKFGSFFQKVLDVRHFVSKRFADFGAS